MASERLYKVCIDTDYPDLEEAVPATSPEEAVIKARQRLSQVPNYRDRIRRDGLKQLYSDSRTGKRNEFARTIDVRYIDLAAAECPLFLVSGFYVLGPVINFNEVEALLQDKKLPKILLRNPNLIPRCIYQDIYEDHPPRYEDSVIFEGEEIDSKLESQIAESLIKTDRCLDSDLARMKRDHLFPEAVSFWAYDPKKTHSTRRFNCYKLVERVRYGFITAIRKNRLLTKEELLQYFAEHTSKWIESNQRAIASLKRKLPERLTFIKGLPD